MSLWLYIQYRICPLDWTFSTSMNNSDGRMSSYINPQNTGIPSRIFRSLLQDELGPHMMSGVRWALGTVAIPRCGAGTSGPPYVRYTEYMPLDKLYLFEKLLIENGKRPKWIIPTTSRPTKPTVLNVASMRRRVRSFVATN